MNWRVTATIIGLLLLGITVGWVATRYGDREDAALCASLYGQARTTTDSARIDANPAPRERGRQSRNTVLTCGELRRAGVGSLRPWWMR